ncbi:hypothetical protein ACLMJK_000317 [Lecanora helva]
MSGTNPFRRRADQGSSKPGATVTTPTSTDKAEPRIFPIDTDVQQPPRSKTGKTVRIISPHSASSEDNDALAQAFPTPSHTIMSPPPPGTMSSESSDDESSEDPFSAASDVTASSAEDTSTRENTLRNIESTQPSVPGSSVMPANPFKKTLANLSSQSNPASTDSPKENPQSGLGSRDSRPHYDVNDFKKLLLTGEKSASASNLSAAPPVTFQSQHNIGDNSSNTDASSTSQQSIFESASAPFQESPGTSKEGSPMDDDRQHLVGSPPTSQRPKPSTPRHRHGKLVKANAPQTVSFEDPSLSFSGSIAISKPPEIPVDIDKALPSLPESSNQSAHSYVEGRESPQSSTPSQVPSSPVVQKRNPPTPPIARRHSQLKQKPLPISERSAPISEEATVEPVELSQSPPNVSSKAPPPPPPRRSGGLVRAPSSSSVSTGASIPSMQSQPSGDVPSQPMKSRPPAPPNYSPSISAVKRSQTQPTLAGSAVTVPPPPPRRRGSSQSSYTPSRLSGEYRTGATERLRSDSGASSISQLQMTPMTATPSSTESKDIMADLSALQREVDELRGKFRD